MATPSKDGSRRANLPHTLLIFVGGVGIFCRFFRFLQFSLSDCSIYCYAEVTESMKDTQSQQIFPFHCLGEKKKPKRGLGVQNIGFVKTKQLNLKKMTVSCLW